MWGLPIRLCCFLFLSCFYDGVLYLGDREVWDWGKVLGGRIGGLVEFDFLNHVCEWKRRRRDFVEVRRIGGKGVRLFECLIY